MISSLKAALFTSRPPKIETEETKKENSIRFLRTFTCALGAVTGLGLALSYPGSLAEKGTVGVVSAALIIKYLGDGIEIDIKADNSNK